MKLQFRDLLELNLKRNNLKDDEEALMQWQSC